MNGNRTALHWIWMQTKTLHKRIFMVAAGAGVFSISSVFFALSCRAIIDAAITTELHKAMLAAAFLFALILLQFILRLSLNSSEERIRSGMGVLLRKDRLHELLKKEYSAVWSIHSGEWMNRFFSDVQIISDGVATILPNLFSMITRLVCAIAVLIVLEPVFAGIFIIGGLLLILLTGTFRKKMKELHKDVQKKQGKVESFLQETIENFLIVRVFCGERAVEEKCGGYQQEHYEAQMKRRTISIIANSSFSLIFQLGYLFALCWGARGLYYGIMTYGTLTAILQLVGQIQGPIANLSGILPKYYGIIASSERLMELNQFEDEPQEKETFAGSLEKITFDHVVFSYGRTEVLRDVSFQINTGDMVALTGLSGGGKSTIFLLLLGIYTANGGAIQIVADGKAMIPGKRTRSLFTYVPQQNGLFSGTILENLQMAKQNATEDEIETALQIACADEFIRELPEGLYTMLGERGNGFSEGQRQRIAIARAVLSEAPVILLDEATSALDNLTEGKVLEHIAGLKNRTCFIVTHREAALHICNKQIMLEDGVTVNKNHGKYSEGQEG
ncbi:MAG: ABC transporter ATP-binding protein [Lachnospiraceae bacterium]|nr:ABC transporter ATP-binding protein [Lachnospiraceae bacterium]